MLFLLMLFAAGFSWELWKSETERENANFTSLVESGGRSINAYFANLETALALFGKAMAQGGAPINRQGMHAALVRFQHDNPEFADVALISPDGQILAAALDDGRQALPNLGKQDFFALSRDALRSGQIFNIGRVAHGHGGLQEWLIPLHSGVRDRDGKLQMIVGAWLSLSEQQRFWRNSPLPSSAEFGLLRDDAYLQSLFPMPKDRDPARIYAAEYRGALARHLREHKFPLFGSLNGENGAVDGAKGAARDYFYSFHRLERYPLTIFVAVPLADLYAEWWQHARAFYLFLLAFLIATTLVLVWTLRRREAWEILRERAEEGLTLAAAAMDNMSGGVMVTDDTGKIVSVNHAFTAITGFKAQEIIGQSPKMLQSGRHEAEFYEQFWRDLLQSGQWQGEIWNRRKNGDVYPQQLSVRAVPNPAGKVSHYVGLFSDISVAKGDQARLKFLAYHDPLTKLPNRALLLDRVDEAISRAMRDQTLVCLMFLDLDRFKFINDSLGHEVGDRLLEIVAARLLGCIRDSDTVARLGGDEFTVILERLHTSDEAAMLAKKIRFALGEPAQIAGHQLNVTASIGISIYPQDGADVQTLLRNADIAMYQAKGDGRDQYRFFSAEMNQHANAFMVMANSLYVALERNELVLHFQPRIDLASGKVVALEALTRWNHPELGCIGPDKFISLAEETGMIVPIGEWVLRTACIEGKSLADAGHPLRIAVNLSSRQFRQPQFVNNIVQTVKQVGFDPRMLDVEITEGLVMQDPKNIKPILQDLQAHGIRVAIDDFGTGYSSLSYLRQFPVDYVKIDRSFVADIAHEPSSAAIVRIIIAMAKNLGLALIAEGVETQAELDMLKTDGCEEAQGYLFSKPVAAAEIVAVLQRLGGGSAEVKRETK